MEKEESIIQHSEIFRERNISLILDGYHDIFSDFDPRPFNERALSDDFLLECKRAAIDKGEDGIEMILSVPKTVRNSADEVKIKQRLREHFHKHYLKQEREIKKIKKIGFIWVILGIIINVIVVSGFINFENIIIHTLLSIFEVPSWFLIWEGMSKILLESKKQEPEFRFYHKMANAHFLFRGY